MAIVAMNDVDLVLWKGFLWMDYATLVSHLDNLLFFLGKQ